MASIHSQTSDAQATSGHESHGNDAGAAATNGQPPQDATANGGAASPLPPQTSASSIIRKKLMGYVGFANLPNQFHRKSVRKGFQFTAMVVGTWHSPLLVSKHNAHGL